MRKCVFVLLFFIAGLSMNLLCSQLVITAEASNYKKTSTYKEVMDFLFSAQKQSEKMHLLTLTTSTEGRMIPLAVISSEGIKSPQEMLLSGKPAVLIMANIHAGEIEGKEATLMLTRDIVTDKSSAFLENQVILVLPIFNADGNDKLGNNRGDNGPELAGVRYNGQHLDLNRDYLKLESPEVRGLVKLFNRWDPVLVVDMHTTNGSYHREPVTYTTQVNPNGDMSLSNYMWHRFFPAVGKILKERYGYDSCLTGISWIEPNREKGGAIMPFMSVTATTMPVCETGSLYWMKIMPMLILKPGYWLLSVLSNRFFNTPINISMRCRKW